MTDREQEPFSPEAIRATQRAWQMGYEAAKAEMQPEQEPVAWVSSVTGDLTMRDMSHTVSWAPLRKCTTPPAAAPVQEPVVFSEEDGVKTADLQLMAAAPELLEALKNIVDVGLSTSRIAAARAAIAKATGVA